MPRGAGGDAAALPGWRTRLTTLRQHATTGVSLEGGLECTSYEWQAGQASAIRLRAEAAPASVKRRQQQGADM